jgi:hypothetical protein
LVSFIKVVEQGGVFRTQYFLQFIYSLHQCVGFLFIFLLSSLNKLPTEIGNLAVGLDLRPIEGASSAALAKSKQ